MGILVVRKGVNEKAAVVEIDGERILFDVAIIDAKAVCRAPFGPFADVAVIFTQAIFERGAFILPIIDFW